MVAAHDKITGKKVAIKKVTNVEDEQGARQVLLGRVPTVVATTDVVRYHTARTCDGLLNCKSCTAFARASPPATFSRSRERAYTQGLQRP